MWEVFKIQEFFDKKIRRKAEELIACKLFRLRENRTKKLNRKLLRMVQESLYEIESKSAELELNTFSLTQSFFYALINFNVFLVP